MLHKKLFYNFSMVFLLLFYYYTNILLQNEFVEKKNQLHQTQQHNLKQINKERNNYKTKSHKINS